MSDRGQDAPSAQARSNRGTMPDETIHDEHPVEPAEGARHPGEDADDDIREHPEEPAEGRRDVG